VDDSWVGEPLPEAVRRAEVEDRDGGRAPLGAHLGQGAALLVFLRHFGCIGCSANVTALRPHLAELAALGVPVVLVGCGARRFVDGFVARHQLDGLPATLVTDERLLVHRAAGLGRSLWGIAGPRAVWDLLRLKGQGHAGHAAEGDVRQQGGAVLLGDDGRVVFVHRSRSLGDFAGADALVERALTLAARRGRAHLA
jgi:peroxiredoxin